MEDEIIKMILGIYLNKKRMLEFKDPEGDDLEQKPVAPPKGDPIFQHTVKLTGYSVKNPSGNRVTIYINIDGQMYCLWVDLDTWKWGYC